MTDWKTAASTIEFPKNVAADLWMDSSDFPLTGKRSTSRKDDWWSYKLNGPGCRYMFLIDGQGRIRKIWARYFFKYF